MANTVKNKRVVEKYERVFLGATEPKLNPLDYRLSLMEYLNYHSAHTDDKDKRKWVYTYLHNQNMKDRISIYEKAPDYCFVQLGPLCKLLNNSFDITPEHLSYVKNKLDEILAEYSKPREKKESSAVVVDVQAKIRELVNIHSEAIDIEIDRFCLDKSNNFSLKTYLLANNVSSAVSKKISEHYKAQLKEPTEALTTECEQLKEAYAFFTKSELKRFVAFLETIVNDAAQHGISSKVRKPRTKKVKPAGVQVSKLKYMFKDEELRLKSIDPKTIIGAFELWIYNVKYKRIIIYKASDATGFGVRGTTLTNYELSLSNARTLRKPELFFTGEMTKVALRNRYEKLTTKEAKPNGRINEDCILLKVF